MQDGKFHYSKVEVITAPLPGTPPMDVYFKGKKIIDSLNPDIFFSFMPLAGETAKLAVYKAGTDTLIVDTLITIPLKGITSFRIGYSEELGIRNFLGEPVSISADSCRFQLFNNLPEVLQPAGVNVDACLYYYDVDAGEQIETGIVFHEFTKKKLHPDIVTVPLKDDTGTSIQYAFKFRNTATGEFLKDQRNNEALGASLISYEGKYLIIATTGRLLIGKTSFSLNVIEI